MDEILNHIEEIEAYYENKLSGEARAAFEKQLELSEELRDELELYIAMRGGLKALGKEEKLIIQLKGADEELDRKRSVTKWLYPVGIAASVIGIAFMLWFIFFSENKYQQLADRYYIPDAGLPVYMSAKSNMKFDQAMQLYEDKRFDEALKLLNTLKQTDTTVFYTAICKFNLKQNAANGFNEVLINKQSVFNEKAAYYKVLSLLRNSEVDSAKNLINKLAKNKHHPFIEIIKKLQQEPSLNEK